MRLNIEPYIEVFHNRRIAVMLLLGFSSGLPLSLTGNTLQAWMAVTGVDFRTIGIFSLLGLPYTLKFLWAPLMDRFAPAWFGRRRGWILLSQFSLILGITAMAFSSPRNTPWLMGILAIVVAFSSASQDVVIDAYRTDVLPDKERGIGTAVFVAGYRVAMLVSGAIAFIIADRLGWQNTYLIMAALMILGIITTVAGKEPEVKVPPPQSLSDAVSGPLQDFFSRKKAISLLLLIVLYKLGDAYAGTLTTAFLIRGMNFSLIEVGTINKGLGMVSLIVGAVFGGAMMVRFGLYRSLIIFGILQAVSNLSFMALAMVGKSYAMMILAVAVENLTGGMGTAAFVSLLMALCNQRYSATQFALLSSLAALGRVFISPTSGYVVESVGWPVFFFITALAALPGLWMLRQLHSEISGLR